MLPEARKHRVEVWFNLIFFRFPKAMLLLLCKTAYAGQATLFVRSIGKWTCGAKLKNVYEFQGSNQALNQEPWPSEWGISCARHMSIKPTLHLPPCSIAENMFQKANKQNVPLFCYSIFGYLFHTLFYVHSSNYLKKLASSIQEKNKTT